ncbi:MAG: SigE family RNA polymerase sigma factor [Acidimicrobiia bacterium]
MMAVMVGTSGGSAFIGRDAALSDLHRDHYRSVVRLACLLVDDVGLGEEVVQDAFVRVYRAWPRVDDPLKYLRTAVMNGARSGLRRRRSARRYVPPTVRSEPGADEVVLLRAEHAGVLDAVRSLPRRQRECLVLRYYADLSEAEIATTLGITAGSVKSHSHRGMAALTVALKEDS